MDEIHHFHETFLHPALVKCGHNLNEIGRVFLEYSDNFEIYSIYCRNSKKSEELRRILGMKNAFLQSCQNKLNHALPLSAYLLKPIQRLTKYQLLIEQLVKYNQSESIGQLTKALEVMLKCLRLVNDSMKNITGYPNNLTNLGRLIHHGSVEIETKRNRVRVSMRAMSRYMFLYERVLILCKKQETTGDFNFKFEFELDGLKIEDDKSKQNRFSLRSKEGRFLSIVLFSKESKMNWVREIKRSIISLQNTLIEEDEVQTQNFQFRRTISQPMVVI